MYEVVFRNISQTHCRGVITWSTYESKEDFDQKNVGDAKKWYQVIEEGISVERAREICSSPEADLAVMASMTLELVGAIQEADGVIEQLLAD